MTSLVIHAEVTCHLLHEVVYLLIGPHKREDQKLIYISRVSLDTFPKSALPQLMERASPERRDRARRYVRIDDCLRCLIADELRAYSLKLDYKVPVQSEVSKQQKAHLALQEELDAKYLLHTLGRIKTY